MRGMHGLYSTNSTDGEIYPIKPVSTFVWMLTFITRFGIDLLTTTCTHADISSLELFYLFGNKKTSI